MQRLDDYVYGVKDGSIVVGREIKLAVERFEADLKRKDLVFTRDRVQYVIDFIESLEHFEDSHKGKPFYLESWQLFIIANIYGFYWKETGLRRFASSYIEIARKNGKTAFAAALCLYNLIFDGVGGAEVLLAANSKDQAKTAFKYVAGFSKVLDPKRKYLQVLRADVKFDKTNSTLKVLASDANKLDSFNASFGLIDEYHAAPTSKVRDVIKSSMGMREQPHLCTITTAGFDKTSPCYQLRTVAIEILNKLKVDDSLFVAIYAMDINDNWQDSENWKKANPNLGVTVRKAFIQEQIQQAVNNPSDEPGVRTKNLNEWLDTLEVWIPDTYILNSSKTVNIAEFEGCECYCGVDLGSTSDITAVSFMFVKDGKYHFKVKYYLPEHSLSSNIDKETYKDWKRQGLLTITPGNVTDYDYITNDILAVNQVIPITKISYDKWNSIQWAITATSQGLNLEPYSQTIGNFNKPTKEFERLALSEQVIIDNNSITRFCFANVILKRDHNGNVKPNKENNRKKIDGVISMLMALGIYLESPRYSNEIY